GSARERALNAVPHLLPPVCVNYSLSIALATQPLDVQSFGRKRGRLAVIGLGPFAADVMVPAVMSEVAGANDVLGYETY
ncbi:precorrin-3B C(17)-methyltransferase, partial [Pseudomonas syringae pv. tagetis]